MVIRHLVRNMTHASRSSAYHWCNSIQVLSAIAAYEKNDRLWCHKSQCEHHSNRFDHPPPATWKVARVKAKFIHYRPGYGLGWPSVLAPYDSSARQLRVIGIDA